MFNLGFPEIVVIGVVALIFIGPKQLPEVARVIARTLNEFKRATSDLGSSLKDVKNETKKAFDQTQISLEKHLHQVENSVDEVKKQIDNKPEPEKAEEEPKHDS